MNTTLQSARSIALTALTRFANSNHFWADFELAFGKNYDRQIALNIRNRLANNIFTPPGIVVVDRQILGTANAAYAAQNNTIYISKYFLDTNNSQRIAASIIEEIGHSIDAKINTRDSRGDEGQIFSALVRGETLTRTQLAGLKAENDHAVITVGGQQISVEQDAVTGTAGDDTL